MYGAAGFLHSIVEEYAEKEGLFRSLGRSVLRVGSAIVKRLAGKKQRVARKPSDWVNLELTMQPASGASLAAYRGALEVIYALATEARKLFLEPAVEAPHSLKEFVGILMGLWTQRQLPSFSFASNDISVARKTFLLAAILHGRFKWFHYAIIFRMHNCKMLFLSKLHIKSNVSQVN